MVGTAKKLDMIPKVQNQYQFEQLRALLKAVKFEYPPEKCCSGDRSRCDL